MIIHLRPGFRKFIKEMQKYYEIVIYSNEDGNFLSEVIRNVDPYQMYFPFFFGSEFMIGKKNKSYKDLNRINRRMNKVIAIDFENNYLGSKNNVIKMK